MRRLLGAYPAQICGASGCHALPAAARDALANAVFGPFQLAEAPRPAPYYLLRLRTFDGHGAVPQPSRFVPSRAALRVTSEDMRPVLAYAAARRSRRTERCRSANSAVPGLGLALALTRLR